MEQLYADSRHRTVHYSYVDKPELRGLLEDYRALPARMVAHLGSKGDVAAFEYQWVTGIRTQDAIGATPWSPGLIEHLKRFGQQTSALATAWTMLTLTTVVVYAHRQGIPLERIVDDPDQLRRISEQRKSQGG